MVDDNPFVIIQFHCQQLKCTRDKFGNVIEGSPNTIQRVYYFWGLQQVRGRGGEGVCVSRARACVCVCARV